MGIGAPAQKKVCTQYNLVVPTELNLFSYVSMETGLATALRPPGLRKSWYTVQPYLLDGFGTTQVELKQSWYKVQLNPVPVRRFL